MNDVTVWQALASAILALFGHRSIELVKRPT